MSGPRPVVRNGLVAAPASTSATTAVGEQDDGDHDDKRDPAAAIQRP